GAQVCLEGIKQFFHRLVVFAIRAGPVLRAVLEKLLARLRHDPGVVGIYDRFLGIAGRADRHPRFTLHEKMVILVILFVLSLLFFFLGGGLKLFLAGVAVIAPDAQANAEDDKKDEENNEDRTRFGAVTFLLR